jgi:hypothetical protein
MVKYVYAVVELLYKSVYRRNIAYKMYLHINTNQHLIYNIGFLVCRYIYAFLWLYKQISLAYKIKRYTPLNKYYNYL